MFLFVYILFQFLYFGFAQSDVLGFMFAQWLQRPVESWPLSTALVLSALSAFVLRILSRWIERHGHSFYWAYVLVSCLSVLLVSFPFASAFYLLLLVVVAVLLGGVLTSWCRWLNRHRTGSPSLWAVFMPSSVMLMVLFVYMGAGAAATDVEHYELRTARYLQAGKPHKALQVGKRAEATSQRLFAMRAYALSTQSGKGLGHHLFELPLHPSLTSASLLLPVDSRQRLLFPSDSLTCLLQTTRKPGEKPLDYLSRCAARSAALGNASRVVIDYYLCALLIDRQLDRFAVEVMHYYPLEMSQGILPRYYAQALVLYTRSRTNPILIYHDADIEADLHDYLELSQKVSSYRERSNSLRKFYGHTYWWWYTYGRG